MLLGFLPLDQVARSSNGQILRSGAFGIRKSSGLLRLILDRRLPNHYEKNLPGLVLPHGVCFCKFLLQAGEMIRLNLRDASNFCYLLKVPPHVESFRESVLL